MVSKDFDDTIVIAAVHSSKCIILVLKLTLVLQL